MKPEPFADVFRRHRSGTFPEPVRQQQFVGLTRMPLGLILIALAQLGRTYGECHGTTADEEPDLDAAVGPNRAVRPSPAGARGARGGPAVEAGRFRFYFARKARRASVTS
ncbi:hypothetical protein [Streptomyces sp. NPDC058632]|uniref:hypothetical protein n=1 Tax=unclassified Streptomyces TaxID=2593676 RepID=UPI0036476033